MYIGGADTVNLHTGTNHGLTNGTTRLGIDVSGRVTMPNQPSFAAVVVQITGLHQVLLTVRLIQSFLILGDTIIQVIIHFQHQWQEDILPLSF